LIPCYARDPQINQCLRRTFHYLFRQASNDGVRQANLPRIDRVYVEDPEPFEFDFAHFNLHDMVVFGMSDTEIIDVRSNLTVL
jgi:hypothetical protein